MMMMMMMMKEREAEERREVEGRRTRMKRRRRCWQEWRMVDNIRQQHFLTSLGITAMRKPSSSRGGVKFFQSSMPWSCSVAGWFGRRRSERVKSVRASAQKPKRNRTNEKHEQNGKDVNGKRWKHSSYTTHRERPRHRNVLHPLALPFSLPPSLLSFLAACLPSSLSQTVGFAQIGQDDCTSSQWIGMIRTKDASIHPCLSHSHRVIDTCRLSLTQGHAVGFAEVGQNDGTSSQWIGIIRAQNETLIDVQKGFLRFAQIAKHMGPTKEQIRISGVKLESFREISKRCIQPTWRGRGRGGAGRGETKGAERNRKERKGGGGWSRGQSREPWKNQPETHSTHTKGGKDKDDRNRRETGERKEKQVRELGTNRKGERTQKENLSCANKQTNKPTNQPTDRQTNKQTSKPMLWHRVARWLRIAASFGRKSRALLRSRSPSAVRPRSCKTTPRWDK